VSQPHVVLGPLQRRDAPRLFRWINDRDQVLFNAPYHPVHEGQHRKWLDALEGRSDSVIFGIRRRRSGTLVGVCQLTAIDRIHRTAQLQIRIGDVRARDRGIGTEAVRQLVRFAFADQNLHRVSLHVFADNRRAIRVYEKAGFTREGRLRKAAHIDGRYVDVIAMGILRSDLE